MNVVGDIGLVNAKRGGLKTRTYADGRPLR